MTRYNVYLYVFIMCMCAYRYVILSGCKRAYWCWWRSERSARELKKEKGPGTAMVMAFVLKIVSHHPPSLTLVAKNMIKNDVRKTFVITTIINLGCLQRHVTIRFQFWKTCFIMFFTLIINR